MDDQHAAEPCGDVADVAVAAAAAAAGSVTGDGSGARGGSDSSSRRYITDVRQADVLGGLGHKLYCRHEGNTHYRDTLGLFKKDYRAALHTPSLKEAIIEKVIASVAGKGGRFLKPISLSEAVELGVPEGVYAWVELDQKALVLKIARALRDAIPTAQTKNHMVLDTRLGECDIYQVVLISTQGVAMYGIHICPLAQLPLHLRAAFPAHASSCASISNVTKGSPAEQAGLVRDDLVCWLGNVPGTSVWMDLPVPYLAAMRLPTALEFMSTAQMATSQSGVVFCLYVARSNSKQARENSTLNAECINQPNRLLTQQFASSISFGRQHPMAKYANSLNASSNNGYSGIGKGPLQGSNVEREQPREDHAVQTRVWGVSQVTNGGTSPKAQPAYGQALPIAAMFTGPVKEHAVQEAERDMLQADGDSPHRANDDSAEVVTEQVLQARTRNEINLPLSVCDKAGVETSDAVVEDSPLALPLGAFDTLDHDGDEEQTDDGAVAEVMVENDGPVDFGREGTGKASVAIFDNFDAELDSRPLFEEREQARLQVSDVALSEQETSHTTREHESTMGMAASKKSEPHLASNINLAEDPIFLSVDTERSLKRGREASSEGIQQEAAPNGHPLPASAQQDAMSAEDLKQDDDGLDFCQAKLRSIRVRNKRLLAKHSDLFNQLESLYTDETIRSAMPDSFGRKRRKFKIEQIPMPSQRDDVLEEQWLRWYACVVLQNARLRSTIERQECKIEDLREYKQLVDQAERAAQELLQRLLQLPTEAESSHEANVADQLANC